MNPYIPTSNDFTPFIAQTNTAATPDALLSQLPQATGAERSQLRAQILKWYVDAGQEKHEPETYWEAQQIWLKGIEYAEQFFREGEAEVSVKQETLELYNRAAIHANSCLKDSQQAIQLYQRGLALTDAWQVAQTTDPRVQELVLTLYVNLGVRLGQGGQGREAIQQYQRGLALTDAWQVAQTTDPRVQELVLTLYVNLGVRLGQGGQGPEEIQQYQRGLALTDAWQVAQTTDPRVQELVLTLYVNLGVHLGKGEDGQGREEIQQCQRGLALVQHWLATGEEQDSKVRHEIFDLRESYTNTLYNTHQIPSLLTALPALGFWSWVSPKSVASSETIKRNWQNKLGITPSYAQVTTAFQTFFSTLVQTWHHPQRPHRHCPFLPTATLLILSESLYALAQAQENQAIQAAYQHLAALTESPWVAQTQQLLDQCQQVAQLSYVPWWRDLTQWWQWQRRDATQTQLTHALRRLTQRANNDRDWQQLRRRSEHALTHWLQTSILGRLTLTPQGLADLPAIAVGMLLASQAVAKNTTPEEIVTAWQSDSATQPWHTTAQLQAAFALTHWQEWVMIDPEKPEKPLYAWTKQYTHLPHRLKVANSEDNKKQPELQRWLEELENDDPPKPDRSERPVRFDTTELAKRLQQAWWFAQDTAITSPLARIFTALADPQFAGNLFTQSKVNDTGYIDALTTLLLGDVERQVEDRVRTWLGWSTQATHPTPVDTVNSQKTVFARIS